MRNFNIQATVSIRKRALPISPAFALPVILGLFLFPLSGSFSVNSAPLPNKKHAVYLMHDDALYGTLLPDPLIYGQARLGQALTTGGWEGELAVDNGYVYLMKNDALYGAKLTKTLEYKTNLTRMTEGGWGDLNKPQQRNYKFDVYKGNVYLMKDGNLYSARLENGLTYGANTRLSQLSAGGWKGEFAVADGYIYLMKDGNLYGQRLGNPLPPQGSLKTIATGGWEGRFDVHKGYLYLMKDNYLYGAKLINSLKHRQILARLTEGGWYGDFAISDDIIGPVVRSPVTRPITPPPPPPNGVVYGPDGCPRFNKDTPRPGENAYNRYECKPATCECLGTNGRQFSVEAKCFGKYTFNNAFAGKECESCYVVCNRFRR